MRGMVKSGVRGCVPLIAARRGAVQAEATRGMKCGSAWIGQASGRGVPFLFDSAVNADATARLRGGGRLGAGMYTRHGSWTRRWRWRYVVKPSAPSRLTLSRASSPR